MPAVDPSIALSIPKPVDPTAQLGQFTQLQNALLQAQNARMDVGAKNALMQAYQGAPIDPKTGLPDVASITSSLQGSRYGGIALPQAIQANQAMRLNAIKNAQASSQVFTSAVGALTRLGNNVTSNQVFGTIKALSDAGYPGTDQMMQQVKDGMPVNPTGTDPNYGQKLHSWLVNTFARDLPASVETQYTTPNLQPINRGPSIDLTNTSTTAGTPGANYKSIPTAMTPAEKVHPVSGPPNAQGQPTTEPAATYAAQHGLGDDGNPLPGVLGTGAYPTVPSALRNPANAAPPAGAPPAPAGTAAPAPSPSAPTPTDVGPGQRNYMGSRSTYSADEMNVLNRAANDVPQQLSQITEMLGDLQKYRSGEPSGVIGRLKNWAVGLGLAPDSWSDKLSAQENFTKMTNQYLAKQAAALGTMTNDKLALAAESGPNPMFSNLGNEGVLHIAQGNADALNVKNQAALAAEKAAPPGTFSYPQWSATFNQTFTPSAFWYARMSPQERQTFLGGLKTPQDRAQFKAELVNAIHQHWISPAALGLPAPPNG